MPSERHVGGSALNDLHYLALSEAHISLCTIQNDKLFSRHKQNHHLQLTVVDNDAYHDPTSFVFTDHSQLSAHLAGRSTDLSNGSDSIEI
jgi:hypothetical protein